MSVTVIRTVGTGAVLCAAKYIGRNARGYAPGSIESGLHGGVIDPEGIPVPYLGPTRFANVVIIDKTTDPNFAFLFGIAGNPEGQVDQRRVKKFLSRHKNLMPLGKTTRFVFKKARHYYQAEVTMGQADWSIVEISRYEHNRSSTTIARMANR